jgi:hypothetical protein
MMVSLPILTVTAGANASVDVAASARRPGNDRQKRHNTHSRRIHFLSWKPRVPDRRQRAFRLHETEASRPGITGRLMDYYSLLMIARVERDDVPFLA